ncbi:flagellar hook-basal body complex protein FliE [Evansella sp. AB-P1]|uniref:flagellar hook-basal body complex protein FliE n=1 Tax=Evansella sp. AB-P1 TaxID=3037653 RepID=UPI002420195F|nr:flagellar hook-basal body complex protein FliE [Evansella sp. AB-P1]MDG5788194.1 flagellar hook-basal body complex protein FliE [Evansella sp. AB-P1]
MDLSGLQNLHSIMKPAQTSFNKTKPYEAHASFQQSLNDAIKNVNDAQIKSQVMTERFVRGENVDLHDVMITAQNASITLQTTVEVRNKAIEAYQEIMRMQV